MKKTQAIFLFVLIMNVTHAQDLTSKMGEPILPQAKDWCIGVDATKLIKKASFDFTSNAQTITGKYMVTAKKAYRIGLRIGVNSWSTSNIVRDRAQSTSSVVAYPAIFPTKENIWSHGTTSFGLSFGVEKRRGNTRLQGFYGYEGNIFLTTSGDVFTYGNKLNDSPLNKIDVDTKSDAMTSAILGNANNIDTLSQSRIQGIIGSARVLERNNGAAFSIGARAFIGAEYFVLPKLSIGGEFGWGFGFTLNGRSRTLVESKGISTNTSTESVKQTTIDGANSTTFRLDNDNGNIISGASASLKLNLYF